MTGSTEHDLRSALTYATHDGVALQGDLYLPKIPGPFPALVAVHGGGWQQGARSAFQYFGPYLAARGYALFAISYRLAKKGQKMYPQAVHDVVAAVQFLRHNAAEHRIDPNRLGLFGASAGGHLAALAALGANAGAFTNGYPGDAQAGVSAKVKVLVGVYGVYDLMEMWERYRADSPRDNNIENFLGCSPMEDRRLYFDATPINYATYANNQTAVLLSCGTEDDLVDRRRNTDAFLRALKQAGFFTRTCYVPGAGHYWASDPIDEPTSYSAVLAPRLIRFLAEKL
ncbi:MAG TPA: alpha/beta fold hydrolase [Xanthobacteraceae bacterium]